MPVTQLFKDLSSNYAHENFYVEEDPVPFAGENVMLKFRHFYVMILNKSHLILLLFIFSNFCFRWK